MSAEPDNTGTATRQPNHSAFIQSAKAVVVFIVVAVLSIAVTGLLYQGSHLLNEWHVVANANRRFDLVMQWADWLLVLGVVQFYIVLCTARKSRVGKFYLRIARFVMECANEAAPYIGKAKSRVRTIWRKTA